MSTEENLRERFRAFAVASFGCGVLNPRNVDDACHFSFQHAGPHSWADERDNLLADIDDDDAQEERKRLTRKKAAEGRRVGTWTKCDGEWCVRIAGRFNFGDIVRVKSKSGAVKQIVLGGKIRSGVFLYGGDYQNSDEVQTKHGAGRVDE